jgi:hypothetical protein
MADNALFVRSVRVETVAEGGVEHIIEADEAERQALAQFVGLAAIKRLTAKLTLSRPGRGMIRVRGNVHAEVTQTCVVSLEPFDVALDEPIDLRFAAPAGESSSRRGAPIAAPAVDALAINDEDQPDPIVDGKIDIGALAAEFMVLALDPYPRKPGVDFDPPPSDGQDLDSSIARPKQT